MRSLNVVVAVPVAGVGLDEADSLLDEAARQQTFAAKGISLAIADAVAFERRFFLVGEVEDTGHLGLHAVG